jgi:MbtH protein
MSNDAEDKRIYEVVVNVQDQYSIWPANRVVPLGWRLAGYRGLKSHCLSYITEAWTDMRPLDLRVHMSGADRDDPAKPH